MTDTSDNAYFERYFHDRAELADELSAGGRSIDANIIATTALDALGEVWLHDFAQERAAMEQALGGKVPPSIRMARLVKTFGVGAPHVGKVAVILFAEDWKRHVNTAVGDADALLKPRRPQVRGELPHAHLDVPRDELLRECPAISAEPLLVSLLEEYEYPALLYRFVRSPYVHYGTSSSRTHGFTRGEEVFYMPLAKGTTIGFSVGVVTAWLRVAATEYVAHCTRLGVRPAADIESARQAEDFLESRWKRVALKGEDMPAT
jgi:hypothetical protein